MRRWAHARRSSSPNTVDVEAELEFTDKKPNQLAPLEKDVQDGDLNNLKVLPKVNAGTLTTCAF